MAQGRSGFCDVVIAANLANRMTIANGNSQCPRPDLHRHFAHFKYAVSALDYVGKVVPREGFAPSTSPF